MKENLVNRQVRREMFQGMKRIAVERAKTFASTPPQQRLAMLDADINKMVAMRSQFGGMKGMFGGQNRPEMSEEEKGQRRAEMQNRVQSRVQDMTETGNPQTQAVMFEYHTAIKARMEQRGIEGSLWAGKGGGPVGKK